MQLARLAYWIVRLSTYYAVGGIIMGMMGVPILLVVLPIFVIFAPAGAYLATCRCPHCHHLVYTVDNFKKVKDGIGDFKPGRATQCPNCGLPI